MANKIYVTRETPIVWKDSGGDAVLTLTNLTAGNVRYGDRVDLGAGATNAREFSWSLTVQFEAAPVVDEVIPIYLSWSDGTNPDGGIGVSDAAGDTNMIKNMKLIGILKVTSTDAAHNMTVSGTTRIPTRYVSPCIYNKTADDIKNTVNLSTFTLTPAPLEVQ